MAVALRYAARSDVGLIRKNNQDSGYAGPHLLVVADGMGGAAGGDLASAVVVSQLAALDEDAFAGDLVEPLRAGVTAAHDELLERVARDPSLAGLGTTVIALLRSGNRLGMIHIGDSRAYLMRDGELRQVTTDHSFVQHLVDSGRLTPEEAEHHPQRSVLLRVLGDNESDVELDEWNHEALVGDRWLLCSDGLSGVVSAETIEYVLRAEPDVAQAAQTLVQLALRGGGPDNITCVVADVVDIDSLPDGTAPSMDPQVVGSAAAAISPPQQGAPTPGAAPGEGSGPTPAGGAAPSRRRLSRILGPLLVLAIVVAGGVGAYRWSQQQYYVGTDEGFVAVFRGIPQNLAFVELSRVHERSEVRLDDLPPFARQRLEEPIAAASLQAAQEIVAQLALEAEAQAEPPEEPEA